ncbi:MAG: tetratricopeptide repeat protein [Candidatus Latescibacteria bacterium]|jgi:tetratricopeptide (TPR) repeat protein|nr:tetratricopeptide repeat protein [Candidatus Latescibacterota bacterium]MBT4137561.1 tetratricopeptide repeat protein [Candidatus Latescibacterota bacterium]MBT5830465.1 tetratricopeptide repeat protein [Candidatus Latescibacterota bacterium]
MKDFETGIWQRVFYGVIAFYGIIVLLTFSEYGITTDEPLHVTYGEHIAQWYGSLFRDHTVFTASNLWLYGGFFDTVIYVLKHVVPMDVYELRHLMCALLGVLGVLGAYKIGALIGGPRAGFLAALFLILTPRYYGHVFNNTKDIPFAVGYLWSLYYLVRSVGALPHLSRDLLWKLGVVLGLTFGIRSSAALLVCYLGLFFGLRYLQVWRFDDVNIARDWRRQILRILGVGVVTYVTVFPFFPYLHLHPVTGVWDSLTAFSKFPEVHYNFFEGQYIASNMLPWYYIPKWLLMTVPEFVMVGLVVGLVCLVVNKTSDWIQAGRTLQIGLLVFAGLFPIVFGVVSHTPLLNGIRHLTFVVPPLVIVSALSVSEGIRILRQVWVLRITGVVVGGAMLSVLFDMVTMHPNQYMYFNRLFGGGLAEAATLYDTDYWNHTYKQGVQWLEENVAPETNASKPVVGSLYKNVVYMIDSTRFGFTREKLHHAHFYLGNAWFDAHKAVPGEVVHTIDVQGVPLLYVIRPDVGKIADPFFDSAPLAYDLLGDALRAEGDLDVALVAYERTLERLAGGFRRVGIDSSGVLHKMGNVLLGLNRYDDALVTFDHIPDKVTFGGSVANNLGTYFIGRKEYGKALPWLKQAVNQNPDFYVASVSLGHLYLRLKDTSRAIEVFRDAAFVHNMHPDHQFELGRLLYDLEQYEDAMICFKRVVGLQYKDVKGLYYLGLAQAALKDYGSARDHFKRAIAFGFRQVDVYQSLGTVYMYLESYEAAAEVYQKGLALKPNGAGMYTMLGVAQMNLKRYDAAEKAFGQAVKIDPEDVNARRHLELVHSIKR